MSKNVKIIVENEGSFELEIDGDLSKILIETSEGIYELGKTNRFKTNNEIYEDNSFLN